MAEVVSRMVEVCIFMFEGDQPRYLLLKRHSAETLYPELWQFVTGSIEEGETALQAATRELFEETGFRPSTFWVLPFVNSFYSADHDRVHLNPVFAVQVNPGLHPTLSDEHSDAVWLPFAKAMQKLVWPGQRQALAMVHEEIVRGTDVARFTRIQ